MYSFCLSEENSTCFESMRTLVCIPKIDLLSKFETETQCLFFFSRTLQMCESRWSLVNSLTKDYANCSGGLGSLLS